MEKYLLLLLATTGAGNIMAQEKLQLRQGQTLEYTVSAGGETFPMTFDLDSLSDSRVELTWHLNDRSGRFISDQTSLDSAANGYYDPPENSSVVNMLPSHNLLRFSRSMLKTLLEKKKAIFDDAVIHVKPYDPLNGFMLNNKPVDALYLESESGMKIWLLNNPDNPIILKMENNPAQVDATLEGIKNNYSIPQLLQY